MLCLLVNHSCFSIVLEEALYWCLRYFPNPCNIASSLLFPIYPFISPRAFSLIVHRYSATEQYYRGFQYSDEAALIGQSLQSVTI